MGCATSSLVVKTQYVPVDTPEAICTAKDIEKSFMDSPYLQTPELDNVETDDDVEVLAKLAMEDVVTLDVALQNLIREVKTIQRLCEEELKASKVERNKVMESIDELNAGI